MTSQDPPAALSSQQAEFSIDPRVLQSLDQRRAGLTTALQKSARTNRTEEVANDLIEAKADIGNLKGRIDALEKENGQLRAKLDSTKNTADSQNDRLVVVESILARHGLDTGSARILTAPQRTSMEHAVKGAIRMAYDNNDSEHKLVWKFDQPYRGPSNQAEKSKLTHLLQNRLATDIPLPSNIQRASVPAFADNAEVYEGIIVDMFNKESRKASRMSVRTNGVGEDATEAAVQKLTKDTEDLARQAARRKGQIFAKWFSEKRKNPQSGVSDAEYEIFDMYYAYPRMQLVSSNGSVKEYTWPEREGVYSPGYLEVYSKILAADLPKESSVLGPRTFHEVPPAGFEVSVAEFYWPDIKFLEWAPQRWMFDATYLANHSRFSCAPFDEPTSIKDVE
ncbi:hypothetical protein QFC20_006772, partial [Naganishia adeliensis]